MNGLDILNFRKKYNLTQKEFAELVGVSPNTIYNYENNGVIPKSKITILKSVIENYNPEITIFKESDNFNEPKESYNIEVTHLDGLTSSVMHVPLVNQYAYGGYLNGFADSEYLESLPKIPFILDKEYKGDYLCFEVKGDSMECDSEESIPEGSILLCRNVRQDYWRSKLHINKWDFVIVHKELGIVVKRIIDHNTEKGILKLHSLNDYYQDFEVKINDVQQIFNIVEVQTKRKRR